RGGLLASLQALFAAAEGSPRKAEEWIQKALTKEEGYAHFHHTAYVLGSAYARMNEPGLALRYLEQAADDGFPCYTLFEKDANLEGRLTQPVLRQNAQPVTAVLQPVKVRSRCPPPGAV